MNTKALVIGVNDYLTERLTSAVNDALVFRKALIELGLVDASKIVLLSSPMTPLSSGLATADSIRNALRELYKNGDDLDRHILYFSGHGVLAYDGSARNKVRTILVPADALPLEDHGNRLIDFSELLGLMELVGPAEQLYFIDACRDMPYSSQPDPGNLGFGERKPIAMRSQSGLYSASPLGRAKGAVNGLGVVTADLLRCLRNETPAFVYDPRIDEYVITMDSLVDAVYGAAKERLEPHEQWMVNYNLPTPVPNRGPKPAPLLILKELPRVPLTVHISPEAAAQATTVSLDIARQRLGPQYCYPDRKNHEAVLLEPQWHRMQASSTAGDAEPARSQIDMRTPHEVTVRIRPRTSTETTPFSGLPVPPDIDCDPFDGTTQIRARAAESQTEIRLRRLEGSGNEWVGFGELSTSLEPGPYHISFRFGDDVFSEGDVFVGEGESVTVSARAAFSPLLHEALGVSRDVPETIVVSESIGPMQSELVQTILPIIGIKPFDLKGELFGQWTGLVAPHSPDQFGWRPLSLVVAIDGLGWRKSPQEIAESVKLGIIDSVSDWHPLETYALSDGSARPPLGRTGPGLQRIVCALGEAPREPFTLGVVVPNIREFYLTSAAMDLRATVVTALLSSDGSFEFSSNILRLPGVQYPNEPHPYDYRSGGEMQFGRLLRLKQLAFKLFASGRPFLGASGPPNDLDLLLQDLLYAKWADPILGCMGYYATTSAGKRDYIEPAALGIPLNVVADNLLTYFPELPDVHVVAGLNSWNGTGRNDILDGLLRSDQRPLLAESVYRLAEYANAAGVTGHDIYKFVRKLVPGQPWALTFEHVPAVAMVMEPA